MTNSAKVKLSWPPVASGGRRHPPTGEQYSTVAAFGEDTHPSLNTTWSTVFCLYQPINDELEQIAEAWFSAPDAPDHLLTRGSRFRLFEGKRLVAVGGLVDKADALVITSDQHVGQPTLQPA